MSYSLQKPMQKNIFSQKAVGGEWPQCLPYLLRLTYTCSHHRYSTTGMVDRHGRRGRDDPVSVNPSTCNLPEVMVNGFRQTRPRPQLRRHSSRYTRPDRTPPFNFIIIAPPSPSPSHSAGYLTGSQTLFRFSSDFWCFYRFECRNFVLNCERMPTIWFIHLQTRGFYLYQTAYCIV